MAQDLPGQVAYRSSVFANSFQRWGNAAGLTIALGICYFLAAQLSLAFITEPDGVAVFWPAAGVSSGALIGFGSGARLPVVVGAIAATVIAHLGDHNIWGAIGFGICNAGEAVLVAGLLEHYINSSFSLGNLRHVLGLIAAAIVGTAVSGVAGTLDFSLLYRSTSTVLTTWHHWVTSDSLGIITVAPLVIGIISVVRDPPTRSEFIEGGVALVLLAIASGLNIFLPREPWAVLVPIISLFPLLLWVAARCRPAFTAAAVFIVSLTIVWTTTFRIGIFGDESFSIANRILFSQAVILTVSLCAFVLAALFAERRANEAYLVRANMMLERERDNKLMNLQAAMAAMAHEVRQPLTTIVANGSAALRFLGHAPPNLEEVRSALDKIVTDVHRTNEVFDNILALFAKADMRNEPINLNETALQVLHLLQPELNDHGVTASVELVSDLPFVMGHRVQIQEVITNLIQNAIEAMDAIKDGDRVLRVRTERRGRNAITMLIEDLGPGINSEELNRIFDAFVTTKSEGIGLGLAISRMIIERHGGQLSASSDGTNGALFQFVLPIETR